MTMIGGCAVIGAGFAVVAFAPAFGFALAGMATAGLAEGAVTVSEQGILQRRTPDAVRSRATAATEAAILAAFALSFPAAGFMINLLGVRGVYLLAGVRLRRLGADPDPGDARARHRSAASAWSTSASAAQAALERTTGRR